jgi:hypothetical protein
LDQHARDKLRFWNAVVVLGDIHGLRDRRELADHLGRFVRLEGDSEFFTVPRAENLDFVRLARIQ